MRGPPMPWERMPIPGYDWPVMLYLPRIYELFWRMHPKAFDDMVKRGKAQ